MQCQITGDVKMHCLLITNILRLSEKNQKKNQKERKRIRRKGGERRVRRIVFSPLQISTQENCVIFFSNNDTSRCDWNDNERLCIQR